MKGLVTSECLFSEVRVPELPVEMWGRKDEAAGVGDGEQRAVWGEM